MTTTPAHLKRRIRVTLVVQKSTWQRKNNWRDSISPPGAAKGETMARLQRQNNWRGGPWGGGTPIGSRLAAMARLHVSPTGCQGQQRRATTGRTMDFMPCRAAKL